MKLIKGLNKTLATLLIALGTTVSPAFADSAIDSAEASRLAFLQLYLQGQLSQQAFEQQMQLLQGTQSAARNPRPYTGPTEVVAPCPSTCPDGLAPNPFKCDC